MSTKLLFGAAISAILISTLLTPTLKGLTDSMGVEKLDEAQFKLDIEKRDSKIDKLEQRIQKIQSDKNKTLEEKEQEIKELRKELQAKRARESRVVAQSAPTPAPVRNVASGGSCEQYRPLLEQYPNWNVDTMLHAMRLESGCNPNAVGDQYVIGGIYAPSCGLLQIRTLPGRPSCEALKDPATNIEWADRIFGYQGYRAWSVLH